MSPSSPPASPRERRAPIRIAIFAGAMLASAAAVLVWPGTNARQQPDAPPSRRTEAFSGSAARDAWDALLQASPYRNVQPGVRYVSDDSCAVCHAAIAESYARHPMGRSLSPVPHAEAVENFTTDAHLPLELDGLIYRARREGNRQFHQETRLSPAGQEALVTELEAVYTVGSGRTGRSYFIERDGYLFMSPLTWYADHGWGLSPGYDVTNSHFNRPVASECLFCHANRALHVAGTINKYESPAFAGHAIGCQRCHGPGELHVAAREQGDPPEHDTMDATIVNPARLEPHLRESVCQQCHLGGLVRVETRGRQREDFRPGLPWSAVEAVYLATTSDAEVSSASPVANRPDRFVGHVEQMHQSGCYVGSQGTLGCLSCHDPHRLPAESVKADYYRQRCLVCHDEAACRLPADERRATQADDSCVACHMPRSRTQIRHAAATDHRIPRSPQAPPQLREIAPSPAWSPLVAFDALTLPRPSNALPPPSRATDANGGVAVKDPDAARNLGLALAMSLDRRPELNGARVLPQTLRLLEHAVQRDPSDSPAREAYAFVLERGPDVGPALRQMSEVLRQAPRGESTLAAAASMQANAGQWSAAAALWNRAREVNPWIVRYWTELALCYARLGRWNECAATCEGTLERFPDSFGARQLLIECRLVAGRAVDAQQELERMIELNPPKIEALHRWWENHPLRQPAHRRAR